MTIQNQKKILFQIQILISLITITFQSHNLRVLQSTTTITFSDSSITDSNSLATISGTTLTITTAGTYTITGTCSSGNIIVSDSLSNVILILSGLTLTSSSNIPISIGSSSSVNIQLEGTSTITDSETSSSSCSGIAIGSSSSLVISGSGTLFITGNCLDGINGAASASVTMNSGNVTITANQYGISAYGSISITGGSLTITSVKTGIISQPLASDTSSNGSISISGGTVKVTTSSTSSDGIQAANSLSITSGTIDVKVSDGYEDSNYDYSTMTCVGIYANNTLNTNKSPTFTITGGTININAPGSGISSSGTLTITGGTITIYSANDALHADSVLTLGKSSGSESDYTINIQNSYEGIEALTINMYSGTINIYSTDDGINAQTADSYDTIDETDDQGGQSGPGGQGGQSGPGGQGGAPGGNRLLLNKNNKRRLDDTPSINLYGGKLYLNADGDGLDSNGNLYIYGGTIEVWGAASGNDDEPFDHDGDLKIYGGTIFAGGTKGTEYLHDGIDAIEQNYIYSNGTTISSGSSISVFNSGSSQYIHF